MFQGGKEARTRTQSWSCVHCRCAAQKKGKTKRSGNLSAHGSHPMVPAAPASRLEDHAGPGSSWAAPSPGRPFFYFYILYFRFLQKYIFNITIYSFVPQEGGRDLFVNKKKLFAQKFLHKSPYRPAAGRPGRGIFRKISKSKIYFCKK